LVDGAFSECLAAGAQGEFTNRQPYVSSFRRNMQRDALSRLSRLVTSGGGAPSDARTLARMHLGRLEKGITALLQSEQLKLDDYSRAHLQDSQRRIEQTLQAELAVPAVN
jgi:hypothetical protein